VDPNIQDEKGFTADIGTKGKKNGRVIYELTAFYIFYKGKIGQILRADRPPLFIDYRFRGNIADARNLGVEMFGELELLNWRNQPVQPDKAWKLSVFTNLALVDAQYINTQDPSIKNRKVEMVPPVMLRSGTTLRRGRFAGSLQFSFASKHFSDATNAKRTSTAVEGIIPSYSVLDVSARYSYKKFALEASLNNLLNQAYFIRRAEAYPGPGIIPADGRGYYITLIFRN
jgi:Fe(3+) dicitrate transport protein